MSDGAVVALIGVIFTGIVTAIVGIYTAAKSHSANRDATRETGMAAWAERLAVVETNLRTQLEKVERRLEAVEEELTDAHRIIRRLAVFIDLLGMWHRSGQQGPAPVPPPLIHEHIDATLWVPRDIPPEEKP